MEKTISFSPQIQGYQPSSINLDHWQTVLASWDAKDYKKTVLDVLKYINEGALKKHGNADQTEFNIPHGSINLEIKITDKLTVKAPFIKLPESPKVPILRQVVQLNFNPLRMARIILENDILYFHFESPIDTCEPYKIWDALYDITFYADKHDDEYITKFKASHIAQPRVQHNTDQELDKALQIIETIYKEWNDIVNYYESKRWNYFIWDITNITLKKLDFCLSPQGFLRFEIEKAIMDMTDKNLQLNDQIQMGKNFMNKVKTLTKDDLKQNMYRCETFVPYKTYGSYENIKKSLENNIGRFNDEYINKKDYVGALLTAMYFLYDTFYGYDVESKTYDFFTQKLQEIQGKNSEQACNVLKSAFDAYIANTFTITATSVSTNGNSSGERNSLLDKASRFFKNI